MTVEISKRVSDGAVLVIAIHKHFTPENCFRGSEVEQHYFLEQYGSCMCHAVEWKEVEINSGELQGRMYRLLAHVANANDGEPSYQPGSPCKICHEIEEALEVYNSVQK